MTGLGRRVRGLGLVSVLFGCGEHEPAPSPKSEPVPPATHAADASVVETRLPSTTPARITAPIPHLGVPDPQCAFRGALEEIVLTTDLSTMTGTLTRISPGRNHRRNLRVKVVARGTSALDLVFLGYGADDYAPISNWRGASAPRERMTPGVSVAARVEVVGDLSRISGRAVDLHSEMTYQTHDHAYPCALIDNDFSLAHPGELIPR